MSVSHSLVVPAETVALSPLVEPLLALPHSHPGVSWLRPRHRQAWRTLQQQVHTWHQKSTRRHRAWWTGTAAVVPLGAGVLHALGQAMFAPAFLALEMGALAGLYALTKWGPWKRHPGRHWALPWCSEAEQAQLTAPQLLSRAQERLERAVVSPEQQAAWEAHPLAQSALQQVLASDVPLLCHDVVALDQLLASPLIQMEEIGDEVDVSEQRWRASRPAWTYVDELDLMSDHLNRHARLESLNTIALHSPYDDPFAVTLSVSRHARWGWEVTLSIPPGKGMFGGLFDGEELEVTVRFDQHPMRQWTVRERHHDTLVLECPTAFLDELHQANRVLVEATFYRSGRRMLQFEAATPLQVPEATPLVQSLPALRTDSPVSSLSWTDNEWEFAEDDLGDPAGL